LKKAANDVVPVLPGPMQNIFMPVGEFIGGDPGGFDKG